MTGTRTALYGMIFTLSGDLMYFERRHDERLCHAPSMLKQAKLIGHQS